MIKDEKERMSSLSPSKTTIYDLPEEILLRIFHHVLPYQDYRSIRLVCRQWTRLCCAVKSVRQKNFLESLSAPNNPVSVHWQLIDPPARYNLIPRHSHATCYLESTQTLYVFGGRRDLATSLNDFWRFHLSTRTWERILPTGNYPPPKCSSTLISIDNERLLLFGGRSMIYIDDFHTREQYHNELHSYSLEKNCWILHSHLNEPSPICDHSASIIINQTKVSSMIIFGGSILTTDSPLLPRDTNDLWIWNEQWSLVNVHGKQPEPRRNQSQFTIDNHRILVVGGSSHGRPCRDVWMFSFETQQWTEVLVNNSSNQDNIPHHDDLSYIPFCLIQPANILVTFGRLKRQPTANERRMYDNFDFSHNQLKSSESDGSTVNHSSSDENDETTRRSMIHRRNMPNIDHFRYNMIELSAGLQIYRIAISGLFTSSPNITWLPSKCTNAFGSPTRMSCCYSLSCARSELILFGGVDKRRLQRSRTGTDTENSFSNRFKSADGTLAIVTVSNIPL